MNLFYEAYVVAGGRPDLSSADYVLESVEPLYTGDHVASFVKRTNCAEIAALLNDGVIGYDPEQQRGWRITYRDGLVYKRRYLIKRPKVKQIAQAIAENREYNRIRTANARHGHVALSYEPYADQPQGLELGRLHLFRIGGADGPACLLTIPDSAHRQEGDKYFTEHIADPKRQAFSPEHAGFSPATYELVLIITLTDTRGEGESHYEHNELITKSSATRRSFLRGELNHTNWVAHQLIRLNPTTEELVEIYETSISANSPKLITFSTLTRGIEDGWKGWLSTSTRTEIAKQLDAILTIARQEIPEWGPLPFTKRKAERAQFLYSQAIVQRAMLRVFGEWYGLNEEDGCVGNWERWRPTLGRLHSTFEFHDFSGVFLSRRNPLFFAEEGGGIYQLNKRARQRKVAAEAEREGRRFTVDPLQDLTVQNTSLSNDFMFDHLRRHLQYGPQQLTLQSPADGDGATRRL